MVCLNNVIAVNKWASLLFHRYPPTMLSRKPTAIKLTQEDVQDYDNFVAAQQEPSSPQSKDASTDPRKPEKGKEAAASTVQERQQSMDERIGVTTGTRAARR